MGISMGTVFENNRTQAVRLPAETRFPDSVKKVIVRAVGKERILSPADASWDSFFWIARVFRKILCPKEQISSRMNASHCNAPGHAIQGGIMLNYMLDTNIIIYVLKHRPAHLREFFNARAGQLGRTCSCQQ